MIVFIVGLNNRKKMQNTINVLLEKILIVNV